MRRGRGGGCRQLRRRGCPARPVGEGAWLMLSLPCSAGAWAGRAPSCPLDGSAFVSLLRRSRFVPFPSLLPPLLLPFRFPSRPPPWRGGSPRVSPRGQRIGGRGIIALVKQSGLCHIPRGKRMISLPVIFFLFYSSSLFFSTSFFEHDGKERSYLGRALQ